MVKIEMDRVDLEHVDLSFVPSLECNLRCSFCMYDCSPDNRAMLNYKEVEQFARTVPWGKVKNVGFYGGEPAIDMWAYDVYDIYIDLCPSEIPRFVITNGTWSREYWNTVDFCVWCASKRLAVKVSSTGEHQAFQNRRFLEALAAKGFLQLKNPDEIHPMGRASMKHWDCSDKCRWHPQPIRLGIFPPDYILMQNCDGIYPVVGTCQFTFDEVFENARRIRAGDLNCRTFRDLNDILKETSGD